MRIGRSVLIGWVAAGAVLAADLRGSFGADLDPFMLPKFGGSDVRLNPPNSGQLFPALFQQEQTSLSQSSSSSFSSGILGFKTDTNFRDTARTDGTSYIGSFIGNSSKWQQNQVGYTNSQMDLGETIRVKTRFGASTYDASVEYFNSLGQKKAPEDQRALRFASHPGPASGAAALTRVEADILKLGDLSVTLFQEFAQVNSLFEDIKFSDKALRKQTKEDVFSTPDRQTEKYGVTLGQGSSGIMFSQSSISDLSGTTSSFYREQRFNSKAWLGLRDITQGFSKAPDSVLGNLIPSSLWVGYSEGAVTQNAGATTLTGGATPVAAIPAGITASAIADGGITTDATIRNLDAGLSWQWGGSYATAGVWRSQQVSNLSTLPTPYFSDGADISFGVQEKKWSASAYTSLSRSSNQDGTNYSGNYSLSGGAAFSVLLEHWPTVTLSFDVSNYGEIYTAWDGKESGRTTSAGIAFDFSKYLVENRGQKLKFFYYVRNEGYDSQWGLANSHSLTVNHVFGTAFRTSL